MEQQNNMDLAIATAKQMVDCRIAIKTKDQYITKIKSMVKWFKNNNPQCVNGDNQLILPLSQSSIMAYFGGLVNKKEMQAMSTMQGYKSALVWYYKQNNMVLNEETDLELNKFMQGYKRTIASMKLDGLMDIGEGKLHLTFAGYCMLAKKIIKLYSTINTDNNNNNSNSNDNNTNTSYAQWKLMLFAWPFFTLQWNLMARSATVAGIMLQHISWQDD